jgi:hypothetical protein
MIKTVIKCDGIGCSAILGKDNGIAIAGNVHVVDPDQHHNDGIGGGLIGDSSGSNVHHYCLNCLAKILGIQTTEKLEFDIEKYAKKQKPVEKGERFLM